MKNIFLLLSLFIPFFLCAQNNNTDEIFHKPFPLSIRNTDNPQCQQCHPVSFEDAKRTVNRWDKNHLVLRSSAHGIVTTTEITDPYSLACLACHNGNDAMNAPVKLPPCPSTTPEISGNVKNHPVFIAYPSGRSDFRAPGESLPGTWDEAQTVNDLMRNGQIVCISCHVPHLSQEKGTLRTPVQGSLLCFGCHRK